MSFIEGEVPAPGASTGRDSILGEVFSGDLYQPPPTRPGAPLDVDPFLGEGLPVGYIELNNDLLDTGVIDRGDGTQHEVRYRQSDVGRALLLARPWELQGLVDNLIRSGFLDPSGSYKVERSDPTVQRALIEAMAYSNWQGTDLDQTFADRRAEADDAAASLRDRQIRAQLSPKLRADPATLRTRVADLIEENVGRAPTREELQEIVDVARSYETEANRINSEIEFAAAAARVDGMMPPDGLVEYDPSARMDEYLSTRYAGTIAQNRKVEEMNVGTQNVNRVADQLRRAIGGSRG